MTAGIDRDIRARDIRVALRDGVHLRVTDRGEGPAAILVHGFTGSVEAWGKDLPARLAGAAGRRVLAVDLPGHGRSDIPESPDRYTLPRVASDLVEVLDHFEIDRADWIGYSMGGRIALGAAALRPDRMRSLILEGGSPGIEEESIASSRRKRDEALARRILAEGIERFVDGWMALPLFESQKRLAPERLAKARERRLACPPLGLANTLRGLGTGHQPSFWDHLPRISTPTLLLTGAEDRKFGRIAERMQGMLPRAVHVSVPEAGHTVHFERPEAWIREVCGFLAGTLPPS